jgi:cbb3-type cytochrome c oxidase subunit III
VSVDSLPARLVVALSVVSGSLLLAAGVGGAASPPPLRHSAVRPPRHYVSDIGRADSTGEQYFRATCAGCHGSDGKGAPQTAVGFSVPLPDFTDCNATARETTVDWTAVIRDGGPVRGFNRIMPAFRDLLTPTQIQRVVAYLRTLCREPAWAHGELNVPLAHRTEKAFPEDELVLTSAVATSGPVSAENHFIYEKRFGVREQLEVDVPFGVVARPGAAAVGALGDATLAIKHVLVSNDGSHTILSGLAGFVLPTGDQASGFGTGTTVFESYLLGARLLPARSYLQLQGGVSLPTDPSRAPRSASWSGALGTTVPFGPITRIWSPMIEVAGTRDLVGGAPVDWSVVPQFQLSLSALQHVRASVGLDVPLTQRDTRHPQLLAYLLWDTFDGPLLSGWKGWCPGCEH